MVKLKYKTYITVPYHSEFFFGQTGKVPPGKDNRP